MAEEQYDLIVSQLNQLLDFENPIAEEEDGLQLLYTLVADCEPREYPDEELNYVRQN